MPLALHTDGLLTIKEAAAYLGVCERTVRNLVERDGLAHVVISRRCVRFRRSTLDAWVDDRERLRSTSGPAERSTPVASPRSVSDTSMSPRAREILTELLQPRQSSKPRRSYAARLSEPGASVTPIKPR
jgi:excisionase family DNA binding protein